jgi:hypothetical protein
VAGIDESNLPALLPHISPKFIYFQTIIIRLLWPDHMPGGANIDNTFCIITEFFRNRI